MTNTGIRPLRMQPVNRIFVAVDSTQKLVGIHKKYGAHQNN
jgi:hypothetical protein